LFHLAAWFVKDCFNNRAGLLSHFLWHNVSDLGVSVSDMGYFMGDMVLQNMHRRWCFRVVFIIAPFGGVGYGVNS
jgi:hypothetical protein